MHSNHQYLLELDPVGIKDEKIELITPQPNIAAPVIKKPSLFPTFVALSKNVDPANVIIEPINISIPVTNKLEDKSDLIISRIRCHFLSSNQ